MKGNLLLGTARGKLGDVVMYRQRGKQMARVRVTKVSNPRTLAQVVQRVVFNTAIQAYSEMQDICNHSFQGWERSVENQAQFMKRNVRILNERISAAEFPQNVRAFLCKEMKGLVLNPYQISAGNLPEIVTSAEKNRVNFLHIKTTSVNMMKYTYRQIAEFLGVPVGSQITLCVFQSHPAPENTFARFSFGRLVLSPSDGDYDKAFFDDNDGETVTINDPNLDNTIFSLSVTGSDGDMYVYFGTDAVTAGTINSQQFYGYNGLYGDVVAYSFITSQYVNNVWRRSDSFIHPVGTETSFAVGPNYTLQEAAETYSKGVWSSKYLNQGTVSDGVGGDEWNGIKERYPNVDALSESIALAEAVAEVEAEDAEAIAEGVLTRKRRRKSGD